jgi:hypothetical protein
VSVCKLVIALYLSVIKRECVTKVLLNPIIRTRTHHFPCAYHPTRDTLVREVGSSDHIEFFSSAYDRKYRTI